MESSEPLAVGFDLDATLCSTMYWRYLVPGVKAGTVTRDWIMWPDGDRTENRLFKVHVINELCSQGTEFCLVIEDWREVGEHIRTLGLGRDAEDLATELLTEASHGR